jgi:hypothetical protein
MHSMLSEHLGGAVALDQKYLVGLGLIAGLHARRTDRHVRHGETDGIWLLDQQTSDVSYRYMTFDDIAADLGRMAGLMPRR